MMGAEKHTIGIDRKMRRRCGIVALKHSGSGNECGGPVATVVASPTATIAASGTYAKVATGLLRILALSLDVMSPSGSLPGWIEDSRLQGSTALSMGKRSCPRA